MLLVDQKHMKTAVIMSEDAAWTKPLDVGYEECLPKIARSYPLLARHHGIHADLQQGRGREARCDLYHRHLSRRRAADGAEGIVGPAHFDVGHSSQGNQRSLRQQTTDAAEGVLYQGVSGPNVVADAKSVPFAENFKKRYGNYPSYAGHP